MELASVNDDHDAIIQSILKRLDRVEKRLQMIEKNRKLSINTGYGSFKDRFYENITIIGLRDIIGSRHTGIQLFWLTFFIICLMSMGYFVFRTCREYSNEPTATKVKLIEDDKYDYPTMLLCPDTWLDADKAIDDGLSLEGLQYALGYLVNYYVRPPPYRIQNYSQARQDFHSYYSSRNFANLVEFFKFVSLDSDAFLYKCPFCQNHTFAKVLMSESICYRILLQPSPGNVPIVSSLDMIEVIMPDRTRDLLAQQTYWRLFLGSDMRLGESTRRYAEIYPLKTNTVQFITHRFISVGIKGQPCIPHDQVGNYSWARCVVQCFIEQYNGMMFLMTACSESIDCDNAMLTPNQTFQFYSEDIWERLVQIHQSERGGEEAPDHCYKRCPSVCQRDIYSIDVQYHSIMPVIDLSTPPTQKPTTTLPPDPSLNYSKSEQHRRKIRARYSGSISTPENLTRIYFLNSAAVYGGVFTFAEVSTYSFETMVGNVGGMLSLWMGVSIMSLIQVVMFFMLEWFKCKKRRPNSNGHVNNDNYQNGCADSSQGGAYLLQSSVV